jgi:hypothetical protein
MAWDPREYDIKQAIMDGAYSGNEVSFDADGFVQKISVDQNGVADVSWYAPSNSRKKHWHFVFRLDEQGKVISGSGRLCHD